MKAMTAIAILVGCMMALTVNLGVKAASGGVQLQSPRIDQSNTRSLQRGASVFVNYCMACHSVGYQRYSRMARDLGLSEIDVENNLIFTTDKSGAPTKVGSLMTNAMSEDFAKQAFGVVPPNLSLTARSRGVDWIYTYMKSFYSDPQRGIGVNNIIYPDAAMPHVLWELQGEQRPLYDEGSDGHRIFTGFEQISEGELSVADYDKLVADLTNFLAYVADPSKSARHRAGIWVILFLLVLLAFSIMLKREYWKDVIK